tara:strand:+ start:9 stop:734 length:726 start_codon:yes stop_codon:yes gene_type:complete
MNLKDKAALKKIQFYATSSYSCGYIQNREAQSIVATPYNRITSEIYSDLIKKGFRRSGQYVYKPNCNKCSACTPIRICAERFSLSKNQKRAFKKTSPLSFKILPLTFNKDHYALYVDYQNNRHRVQESTDSDEDDYNDFLIKSNVNSKIIEFRSDGILKVVTIVDFIDDGISAVYTFFDTKDKRKSFGTYSILWLMERCKEDKLKYLYLGYWIDECAKMEYKTNFMPYELLINNSWQEASS